MANSEPKLVIVTLTRDNPEQLELTLRSVRLQTRKPARHIVLDGSSDDFSDEAARLARESEAEYLWIKPEGIYPAMDFSTSLIDDDDYVLWLNSSDWLAGPTVLEGLYSRLTSRPLWVSGRVWQRSPGRLKIAGEFRDSAHYRRALLLGLSGFPHPATVLLGRIVKQAGGFSEERDLRIAADYDLGLRMIEQFGPPIMISLVVSVHVTTGFSAQHQARGYIERFASRLRHAPWRYRLATVTLSPGILGFAVLRRLLAKVVGTSWAPQGSNGAIEHFCGESDTTKWPHCCDETLNVFTCYPEFAKA